ncbi:MAG: radical SAM protein [Cyclobacteriaceae bacterium]|nr:radical SAM protein [Cyclobacteriaceae bacterium]
MPGPFHDALSFAGKLTANRLANAWTTWYGFRQSLRTKDPHHPGLPWSIAVEPTTSCNLRCPECPSGLRSFTRPTGMMSNDTLAKLLDEIHEYLLYMTLYFQGEPYLNPQFFHSVRLANERNIYTATSTNGHFLTPQFAEETVACGLSRLIISMDGTDQETYAKYRIGGHLEKVKEGIGNLVAARKKLKRRNPYIILQFILFGHNVHQQHEVRRLARELGVDKLEFKTAQIYDFKKGSPLIPVDEALSRYKPLKNGQFSIKSDLRNKCWKMWHSCVMTWDGDIVPCCFDKDAKYTMGNIYNSSFREIWNRPALS